MFLSRFGPAAHVSWTKLCRFSTQNILEGISLAFLQKNISQNYQYDDFKEPKNVAFCKSVWLNHTYAAIDKLGILLTDFKLHQKKDWFVEFGFNFYVYKYL